MDVVVGSDIIFIYQWIYQNNFNNYTRIRLDAIFGLMPTILPLYFVNIIDNLKKNKLILLD